MAPWRFLGAAAAVAAWTGAPEEGGSRLTCIWLGPRHSKDRAEQHEGKPIEHKCTQYDRKLLHSVRN